jgi:hypothetical protein
MDMNCKQMITKTSAKGKYRVYESSTKFERAILFNSSEQLLTDGRKLMAGVSRIVIGKHFNVIEMLNGRKNVYTSDWHLLTRRVIAYCTWGDVIVTSEYEVEENSLKITILRSIGVISNPNNPMRTTPAGPPIEVPNAQQLGENCAEFSIAVCSLDEMQCLLDEIYPQTILL